MGCCDSKAINKSYLKICILDVTNEEDYDSSISEIQTIYDNFNIEPMNFDLENQSNIECQLWRMQSNNEYTSQARQRFYTGCDGLIIVVDNCLFRVEDRLNKELEYMKVVKLNNMGDSELASHSYKNLKEIPKQFVSIESQVFENLSQIEKHIKDDITFVPQNYEKSVPDIKDEIKRLINFKINGLVNKLLIDNQIPTSNDLSTDHKQN